ncbi:SDR family NAD(P)-dependent oxidoreductase [Tardiphaga alba]|uniref:SDR family NAD(P)-dependent oxidoreductase n=1 Tax=Tardiphaga alba TaxID=340268 RepID=A0ABX8ACD5_9BRAD|nr:SDR family NAD(P)-dependent oxidoreductase [Tardiphaga alba]QUS40060.1 SDR family NAD(P)-dependent oxidoreductase [Tardiphaga alba]
MSKEWTLKDIPSMAGKRIIVTGASNGIGWHTALELVRAGADVTIASRNEGKAADAARRILSAVPTATVRSDKLDLAHPDSVQSFAERQLALGTPLDILINNAGVMALPDRRESVDGHEMQFATNVLGPYRLTALLLPALLKSSSPRVVTVASGTHAMGGPVPIQDLDAKQGYKPIKTYAKTKLANILVAREFQRRAGDRLLSACSHPGAAKTNLFADTSKLMLLSVFAMYPLIQSAAAGAEPTLMVATSKDIKPGGYYGPGGFMRLRGHPAEDKTAPIADDIEAGRILVEQLEHMTGVKFEF